MLRAIRACASLLVLEDEHSQGWRLCFARAFRVVSIREAYPFPTLLLCCSRCISSVLLLGLTEKFFMQAREDVIRV